MWSTSTVINVKSFFWKHRIIIESKLGVVGGEQNHERIQSTEVHILIKNKMLEHTNKKQDIGMY